MPRSVRRFDDKVLDVAGDSRRGAQGLQLAPACFLFIEIQYEHLEDEVAGGNGKVAIDKRRGLEVHSGQLALSQFLRKLHSAGHGAIHLRKDDTENVFVGQCFGQVRAAFDTHVQRLAIRRDLCSDPYRLPTSESPVDNRDVHVGADCARITTLMQHVNASTAAVSVDSSRVL